MVLRKALIPAPGPPFLARADLRTPDAVIDPAKAPPASHAGKRFKNVHAEPPISLKRAAREAAES